MILKAVYFDYSLISYFKLVVMDVSGPTILAPHPIHMHGHKYFVVAMERYVDNITLGTYLDNSGIGPHWTQDRAKISKTHILVTQ